MKREYRVQWLWTYSNGESEWEDWGQWEFDTLDDAQVELRRGKALHGDKDFRIVQREVTDWVPMEEAK